NRSSQGGHLTDGITGTGKGAITGDRLENSGDNETEPDAPTSGEYRARDLFAMRIADRDSSGCVLLLPSARQLTTTSYSRSRWEGLATHLIAGLRLRRQGTGHRPPAQRCGRCAPVTAYQPPVHPGNAAQAWQALAIEADRARGAENPHDVAVTAWQGLMSGQWTMLSHFTHRGRRYVLARRVRAGTEWPLRLTPSEMRAIRFALSPQYADHNSLAEAMNIKESTLTTHLNRALKKLGLRSRAELLATLWFEPLG
ncbi:MAG: LuxR C-terminal-related transcriptional regulator, partial [Myxococcota bacterium]